LRHEQGHEGLTLIPLFTAVALLRSRVYLAGPVRVLRSVAGYPRLRFDWVPLIRALAAFFLRSAAARLAASSNLAVGLPVKLIRRLCALAMVAEYTLHL
jgi:hypothetical protein